MPRSIRFTRIVSMTDQLAAQLQGLQFAGLQPPDVTWRPDVNVYAYADCIEVCVDLAGARKQDIKVEVEPRRLVIRGQRQPPDGGCDQSNRCRILVMEIADGSFERVLEFPVTVDTERVVAKQDNGWLWITLPVVQQEDES
ncbi:Hsp20/alpha crystallin family protein [Prosthecobacter sp.]|uniref:Hsp20/alpha crystallin family protein n=1 Tax=Prosthecobacter sp. TaxID=1965333 RepID=UPI002AB7F50E|nr:Hsp20/alpha crystallin family protein [Prosthecobacter sp.]MDZ4403595.1 Hsp20/alpha crystallin family protein [Prosthecobacter sp.]